MAEPRVSVVVPAYNATATIAATLRSIQAQTLADFELIVIDDGSSDGTPDLVDRIARDEPRLRLHRQANGGTAAARNAGIARARGEFVALLDNDDLWMPRYLELMTAALVAAPDAGFAYTDAWVLDDSTKRVRTKTVLEFYPPVPAGAAAPELLRLLIATNFVMSSVTARRTVLEEVGGFDPAVSGVDDYDLWLRILAAGHAAVPAPAPLLIQRDRHDSQSKDELTMISGHLAVLRRLAEDPHLDAESQRTLSRETRRFERWADGLAGRSSLQRQIYRLRGTIGRFRERRAYDRDWPAQPPAEVAAAFPDLASV